MARLTSDQWDAVKADYALGRYTSRELGEKHGVSHTAINKRADAEGWVTIEGAVVRDYVGAQVALSNEVAKVAGKLSIPETRLETALNDLATFEIESNRTMARIEAKALDMLETVERPGDVKAIMDVHKIHREARLGKSPETAIQINNANSGPPALTVVFDGRNSH